MPRGLDADTRPCFHVFFMFLLKSLEFVEIQIHVMGKGTSTHEGNL